MPTISERRDYNGVVARIERLGLAPLIGELEQIVTGFELRVREATDANGGAAVRKLIDLRFESATGWTKKQTGDIDWTKCASINGTRVCIGVEIQMSARSDLLIIDVYHLLDALQNGTIDVAVLVVPDDALGRYLTDRGPNLSAAIRHVERVGADKFPFRILALHHDGAGEPLAKQFKSPRKKT